MTNKLPDSQQNIFNRNHPQYPKDEVQLLQPTYQYLGEIKDLQSKQFNSNNRIVDGAIIIKSVDSRTRQTALEYFTSHASLASKERQARASERAKGISATILGASFLAASPFLPILGVALLAGGAGLATGAAGINLWHRSKQALTGLNSNMNVLQNEREQWNDPADIIIKQRRRVGLEGFQYVFNNDLKNTIVHPEEVRDLWIRDVNKIFKNPIDPVQIFNNDIFGKARFEYACPLDRHFLPAHIGERTLSLEDLTQTANLYQKSHEAFQTFEKAIASEFTAIKNRRTEMANEISSLRTQWLIPAEKMHQLGSLEIENLHKSELNALAEQRDLEIASIRRDFHYVVRDPANLEEVNYKSHLDTLCRNAIEAARQSFQTHPVVISIQRAYEKDRRMNTLLYNQSKLVVDNFFDQRLRQLDKEVAMAKQKVEQQRLNGHQHFANILDRIFHPQNGATLDNLSISSPPIARQWSIENSSTQPSWHDVYSQRPSFHASFANDLSETEWNRFWGIQGLGRFSSQPVHLWNTLFTDRSHFPLQSDWFNLRRCSQRSQRPTFCRPVVVPPPPFHREAPHARPPVRPDLRRPPLERDRPMPQSNENHVPVGIGRTEHSDRPRPPVVQERPAPPSNGGRVQVGFGTTERRPDRPTVPVAQERPAPQSDGGRVPVGLGTTERRPDRPAVPVAQERPTPQNNGGRVQVGYGRTERR